MQIVNGAVVLKPSEQAITQIQQVIPGAKSGVVGGRSAVAVKHELEQVLVLRNLGYDVPSPINFNWTYPGMFKPRDNQYKTSAFMTLYRRAFILNAMRTGKTNSSLWGAEYLLQKGFVRRILIVCPKTCMRLVWGRALFETLPHRGVAFLSGSKEERKKQLDKDTEFCVINHDGITALAKETKKGKTVFMDCEELRDKFDLIIYDEADVLCNHRTKLYKAFKSIVTPTTWLWLMSGTPTPNEYADAWGLLQLVCGNSLPVNSWTKFREMLMTKISQYKWVNKPNSKELLHSLMQPSIRFTQKECFDLPEVQYIHREAELSKEQKLMYWQMQKDGMLKREEGDSKVTAPNAAVKMLKMIQIACGAVKDEFENKVAIDSKPRVNALLQVLHELEVKPKGEGKKTIIAMPFTYSMEDLQVALVGKGFRVGICNGNVTGSKRDAVMAGFEGNVYDILLAHPETTGHGLDLTVSESIIWYAPCFGNRYFSQLNNRILGEKQKGNPVIVYLSCTRLERERYASLQAGVTSQDALLSMYENALLESIE